MDNLSAGTHLLSMSARCGDDIFLNSSRNKGLWSVGLYDTADWWLQQEPMQRAQKKTKKEKSVCWVGKRWSFSITSLIQHHFEITWRVDSHRITPMICIPSRWSMKCIKFTLDNIAAILTKCCSRNIWRRNYLSFYSFMTMSNHLRFLRATHSSSSDTPFHFRVSIFLISPHRH